MASHFTTTKIKIECENQGKSVSGLNPNGGMTIPDIKPFLGTSYRVPTAYQDSKEDIKPHLGISSTDTKEDIKPCLGTFSTSESERVKRIQEYKQRILSSYQPMHRRLYEMNYTSLLVPSFLEAVHHNTEIGFRKIISEPSPGVLAFDMFKPELCQMLIEEYKNFEKWAHETGTRIMRPNTMNEYGAVLDDFGLERMLGKLMEDCVLPMSTIFFGQVGGAILDSHHGSIVEYGAHWAHHLGFHVDDSEVTLNICLGEQFSGGELFFNGIRCVQHMNVESELEERFDYSQVPGRAVMYVGRHRHGALSTTSGHRVNMVLWCRSSIFREMSKEEQNSPSWCRICEWEKNK